MRLSVYYDERSYDYNIKGVGHLHGIVEGPFKRLPDARGGPRFSTEVGRIRGLSTLGLLDLARQGLFQLRLVRATLGGLRE